MDIFSQISMYMHENQTSSGQIEEKIVFIIKDNFKNFSKMNKDHLLELIQQKDQMQKTIAKLTEQLDAIDKAKGFDRSLVDKQGFPRQDLNFGELSNYRNLKRKRAELNNDHVKLMKQIQTNLFQYHTTLPKVQEQQQVKQNFYKSKQERPLAPRIQKKTQMQQQNLQQKYVIDYLTPFAKISLVQEGSPSYLGGIRVSDLLSEFSQVNIYTPDNIKQIPCHVKEDHQLKIVIMRPVTQQEKPHYQKVFTLKDKNQYAKVQLKITPRKWAGKGLMGCKIDPF